MTCTLCWGPLPQPLAPDLDTLRSHSLNRTLFSQHQGERHVGKGPRSSATSLLVQPTPQGGNLPPAQQQPTEPPRNPEAGGSNQTGAEGLAGRSELC